MRTPGAFGCAGDPLDDPTVALQGSHHCRIGSTTSNLVEHRVVPYQAAPAQPHLMTPPASLGFAYPGSMRGVWHHHDRRRRGPRELTGIVDHSREGTSHGPLEWTWCRAGLAPCTRTGWPSAEKTSVRGHESRRWIPSRDIRTPLTTSSKTQPACSTPFISSSLPVMPHHTHQPTCEHICPNSAISNNLRLEPQSHLCAS